MILPTANEGLFGSNSKEQGNLKYSEMEDVNFSEIKSELKQIKQLTLLGAKKALTMSDCALLTGLSKSHLYKLVCAKKIPYYKSEGGKLTYFDKSEVEAWQLQHRVKTQSEVEAEAVTYVITGKKKRGAKCLVVI